MVRNRARSARKPPRRASPMEAELGDIAATTAANQEAPPALVTVAKGMGDLDDLVRLLAKGLSRAKPWQLHLAAHLAEADRLMQVLRLTVALDRSHTEIVEAAVDLHLACRRARQSLAGTRADRTTVAAMQLSADLAASIVHALQRFTSTR